MAVLVTFFTLKQKQSTSDNMFQNSVKMMLSCKERVQLDTVLPLVPFSQGSSKSLSSEYRVPGAPSATQKVGRGGTRGAATGIGSRFFFILLGTALRLTLQESVLRRLSRELHSESESEYATSDVPSQPTDKDFKHPLTYSIKLKSRPRHLFHLYRKSGDEYLWNTTKRHKNEKKLLLIRISYSLQLFIASQLCSRKTT